MLASWQVTLSTTAEQVVDGSKTSGKFPSFLHVSTASAAIRIGGDDTVDSTDGYPFSDSSSPLVIALQPGDDVYMVAESGTPTVQVMLTRTDVAGSG